MSWLDEEQEKLKAESSINKYPEAVKLKPNVISTITIDFGLPFEVWSDEQDGTVKAIIPVWEDDVAKTLWLNKRNPLYHEIIQAGRNGQTIFKILRTGEKHDTRYTMIKDS